MVLSLLIVLGAAGCLETTSDTTWGDETNTGQTNEDPTTRSGGGSSSIDIRFAGDNFAYRDGIGYYNVVGEVKNHGERNVELVKVTGTFYGENDTVHGTSFTFTTRDIIAPGEVSPFTITIEDSNAEITEHKLTVSGTQTDKRPPGSGSLTIQGTSDHTDSIGYYHVVGEVLNNANRSATYVQIAGSFYDSEGDIIASGWTFTDPSEIQAGEAAPFDLAQEDNGIASYRLWVDAQALR